MKDKELFRLVGQAKRGSGEAFAKIYKHYAQSIYYLGLKITKNEYDAQDIVQETMYKVYSSLHTLKKAKAIGGFINRTAYNTCISFVRDRMEVSSDDDSIFTNIEESSTEFMPEEDFSSKEMEKKILHVIDDLTDSHRIVIILFYYESLSIKEIAELLDISQQAVKNRLFRAKENMKAKLIDSSLKGVVMFTMLFPAVTKALTAEAKASFSSVAHRQIWIKLGPQIGLTTQETASTLAVASAKTTALPLSEIASIKPVTPPIATGAKVLVGTLAAGVVVVGGGYLLAKPAPTPVVENSPPVVNSQPKVATQESTPESKSEPSLPPVKTKEEPAVVENAPFPKLEEQPESAPVRPVVLAENKMPLRYVRGTTVTPQMIATDGELKVTQGGVVNFIGIEEIDIYKTGDYAVYLQAVDENGNKSDLAAVIIHIY